jgi:hypothetical protein
MAFFQHMARPTGKWKRLPVSGWVPVIHPISGKGAVGTGRRRLWMSEEGVRGAESRTAQRFCRTGDGRKIHEMKNFRVFHKIFAFETICYGMFQNCVSMFQF